MQNKSPVAKDLVLVGGGHAHVTVLKRLGMKPVPGLRVTLITRDIHTPYSGMLPGYIGGFYDHDECHIDLGPLARFAGARLYHTEVEGLDTESQLIHAAGRPSVAYDLLSINIGSRPGTIDTPGVHEHALIAKPIDIYLRRWEQLQQRIVSSSGDFHITIVGGGAGGAELALSSQHRLRELLSQNGDNPDRLHFRLLTSSERIMFNHNDGVRRRFERIFGERNIDIGCNSRVTEVTADSVQTENGESFHSDAVIWVTSASAPSWPREAGLAVDGQGFISVNDDLQSLSHKNIFAAGDIASLPDSRPKSGVFAVRQGPVLKNNLKAAATGGRLRPYRAQKNFLGLISTGNRYAVASRGDWSYESAWLWKIKDWIDVNFMRKFNELPEMTDDDRPQLAAGIADSEAIRELSTIAMRCG
ncbi:MAG: FAD-dependent oxidoreductase, partial [Gammaproteobacteria bacterium]|nr:FAD-dependent oxidoreductase [Gammaproteobacteria bacterium]